MPNIRIKKAPRTGEQEDYALVYNDVATSESKPKEGVKTTMTAVPREQANVEVEGNESVIGDINQDGFLELMTFQGKRHSEGGMPVNIPDGSFIFSDTSKLKIKDPELLKYFGMGNNKKGYTPAQISKKYQINEYIDTLKNEDADDIAKKTANEMLKNNTKKLAELAIVQESMKGFENGVPDFAASVMAGLQGEQPQMKDGGWLPKAQWGVPSKYKDQYKEAKSVVKPSTTYVSPLNSTVNNIINKIQKQSEDYSKWKHAPDPNDYTSNKGVGRMILGVGEVLPIVSVPATAYELINNYRKGEPMEDAFWNLLPFANTVIGAQENIKANKEKKKEYIKDYEDYYNNTFSPTYDYTKSNTTYVPVNTDPTINIAGATPEDYYNLAIKLNQKNTGNTGNVNNNTINPQTSTGTSSYQTYVNPNSKREEKTKKYESYYSEE